MTEHLVDMASVDETSNTLKVSKHKVRSVKVNIKNHSLRLGGQVYSDVVCGSVPFRPGEVKTLQVSEAGAAELRARTGKRKKVGAFELTSERPHPGIIRDEVETKDEQEANEEANEQIDELLDQTNAEDETQPEPVQRIERRRRKS